MVYLHYGRQDYVWVLDCINFLFRVTKKLRCDSRVRYKLTPLFLERNHHGADIPLDNINTMYQ
jgi:hypothetical protein